MTNIDYAKSCTEVLTIINNMSIENFNKLPSELIESLKKNKDANYNFYLDYSKSLKEQNISEFTMAILKNIYRDYWVTQDVRKNILLDEANKRAEKERNKQETFNIDNVFKNMNKPNIKIQSNTNIIPLKKENILQKFIKKFISIFGGK